MSVLARRGIGSGSTYTRLAAVATFVLFASAGARADGAPSAVDFHEQTVLAELAAPPRVQPVPAKVVLNGRLQEGFGGLEVIMIRPDGRAVIVPDVKLQGAHFRAELRLSHGRGIYRVEITGIKQKTHAYRGASLRFFAGVPADHPDAPPPDDVYEDPTLPTIVLEHRLFDRVNAHREAAGLEPLEWLEPVAELARQHARRCVVANKLDHEVGRSGTLAQQATGRLGWTRVRYLRPSRRPTKDRDTPTYFAVVLEARKGLAPVLHRWGRFAAFCLPMTSEVMTHAACGIARTAKGALYIVFAFVQVNGVAVPKDLDRRFATAFETYRGGRDDEIAPDLLRAVGRWRWKKGTQAARRQLKAKRLDVRAAAWDVMLLTDEAGTEAKLDALWAKTLADVEAGRRFPAAGETARWLQHLAYRPQRAAEAKQLWSRLEADANEALARAQAIATEAALPSWEKAYRDALRDVVRDFPGTAAAETARERLAGP